MFSTAERNSVSSLAIANGFEPAVILAFTQVESGGRSFWNVDGVNKPAIRPEGHYFYRLLKATDPEGLETAVRMNLAAKSAGAVKVPSSYAGVYAMFQKMVLINADCAYQSISIGVGQVMGEHAKTLGFIDAKQMYNTACSGLSGQVDIMLRFIKNNAALANALKTGDWKTAAKLYNGAGYKANKYDIKLGNAVKFYRAQFNLTSTTAKQPNDIDEDRINDLGYESVEDFQKKLGLKPDGDIGPMTSDAITKVEEKRKEPASNGTGAAVGGGGTLLALLTVWQSKITDLMPILEIFKSLGEYGPLIVAAVAGAAIVGGAVYGVYKIKHRDALA